MDKLKKLIATNKFYYFTLAFFVVQVLFFVVAVNVGSYSISETTGEVIYDKGVAPDEVKHKDNILYYADRPILAGPIIEDAKPEDLRLGEIERFPSYFYYYMSSFVVKFVHLFSFSDTVVISVLRLQSLLIGLSVLLIVRKILIEVELSSFATNSVVFLFSATGMFAWMSASINYDIPSLALFFLVQLYLIRSLKNNKSVPILTAIILTMLLSITKYTYLPFAAFGILYAGIIFLKKQKNFKKAVLTVKNELSELYKKRRVKSVILILLSSVVAILFIERIIGNLIAHQSFLPECQKIHSVEDCSNYTIFKRNYFTRLDYINSINNGAKPVEYNIFSHGNAWFMTYYKSLFYYVAQKKPDTLLLSENLAAISVLLITAVAFSNRKKIFKNEYQRAIFWMALMLVLFTYLFNVKTFLTLGQMYAYQGRYIFGSLIGLYMGLVLLMINYFSKEKKTATGIIIKVIAAVIFTITLFLHLPLVSFLINVGDASWYTDYIKSVIPEKYLLIIN